MLIAKDILVILTVIMRRASCDDYTFTKIGVTGNDTFTPVATHNNVRAAIECGMVCKDHEKCRAYTYDAQSESCALYAHNDFTPATEPAAFHVFRAMVVIGSLLDLTEVTYNSHQLYRGLDVKDPGRARVWKFRVSQAGVVYLSVWRSVTSTSYQLVGKTRAEVTEDQVGTLITLELPEADRFDVEAGDVLGTFYDPTQSQARVSIEQSPNGHPALPDADLKPWSYNNDAEVYDVGALVAWTYETSFRCPQMALYLY